MLNSGGMPEQNNPSIELQDRDVALLRDLFVSRIMTLAHIAAIHFDGRAEAAKKRVQKLKTAGFVAERPRKARDPGILCLTKQGFDLLNTNGHLSDYPKLSLAGFERRARVSDLTLRHELEVMDAKAAFLPAIGRTAGMTVVEFCTWPMLCQFDVHPKNSDRVRVKPDGLFRVREQTPDDEVYEHAFFLEVDRGTETLDTLARKAVCYREHYSSGGFAMTLGGMRSAYAEYPFRVLFVLPSEERLNNITERLLAIDPPIETQVWLTTSKNLIADPLGSIWIRPRDYRDANVSGKSIQSDYTQHSYRRLPEYVRGISKLIAYRTLFMD